MHHPACLAPKFDAGYVRDHSPLPVPFRTYCSILSFDLVGHFDVLFTFAPSTGIPVYFLVNLKRTWDQKLFSLAFFYVPYMSYHLLHSLIWCDVGHVPDHSPLPVLFCRYYAFPHSNCLFSLSSDGVLGTLL